jgi:hypothetical protein
VELVAVRGEARHDALDLGSLLLRHVDDGGS